jgi:flagellar basal body P-ring formation protein FlgA
MKSLLALVVLCGTASAAPVAVDTIVRDRIGAALPEDLGVVDVFLPASLASLATEPERVTIEMPRALGTGRSSAKVLVRGRASVYVPFSVSRRLEVMVLRRAVRAGAAITADDVTVERRAVINAALPSTIIGSSATRDLAVGNVIAKADVVLSAPLARGTQVSIEMRKGRVIVRGTGVLEAAARNGESTSARLAQTRVVVRGTLRAQTLFVGEN